MFASNPHRTLLRRLVAGIAMFGAAATGLAEDPAAGAERLAFMKKSVAEYVVKSSAGDLKLTAEPILRWDNPVSKVPDGTVFLWSDRQGRPAAIVGVFSSAKDWWMHEFQSLTTGTFEATRGSTPVWTPTAAGIEWKALADAPLPAESKAARLAQMRQLARRFEVEDRFEGKGEWELRLLATPLHRYGDEGSEILDGAIFAFAHGTDPELFVMFEARSGKTESGDDRSWMYALAPMSSYALDVRDQGQVVWSLEQRRGPQDPRKPFFRIRYLP